MQGGFVMEERGLIEVKVRSFLNVIVTRTTIFNLLKNFSFLKSFLISLVA